MSGVAMMRRGSAAARAALALGPSPFGGATHGSDVELLEDGVDEAPGPAHGRVRSAITRLLNSTRFNVLTALMTTFALFGDDIRVIAFRGDGAADAVFSAINVFVMGLFIFEIGALISTKSDYCLGFYFYLDFVSTASMIFDIHWLRPSANEGSSNIARTGRISKGAKSGRVVRIARLVRLVRIVKLFKLKKHLDDKQQAEEDAEEAEIAARQPSKVAKKLTELTTRKVIILLLCMVAFFPVFDERSPAEAVGLGGGDDYKTRGLLNLERLRPSLGVNETGSEYCRQHVDEFCSNLRSWTTHVGKLRYLRIGGVQYDEWLQELYFHHQGKGPLDGAPPARQRPAKKKNKGARESEKREYGKKNKQCESAPCTHHQRWNPRRDLESRLDPLKKEFGWRYSTSLEAVATAAGGSTFALFEETATAEFEAVLNLCRMAVVVFVLTAAVMGFTQDATTLVVGPIERMMSLVQRLAENPLKDLSRKRGGNVGADDETFLLEQTLAKISGLLRVGFGAAGAEVISKSMQVTAGGGAMNYMLPGKRITAVFGFAIIEDFTVTCGCLEAEICLYINTVARIVHEGAQAFHGAPNKNIGCAFLLVWKICEGVLPGLRDLRDTVEAPGTPEYRQWLAAKRNTIAIPSAATGAVSRRVAPLEMVESALASFIKVQVDLHHANGRGGALEPFSRHAAIVAEFGAGFRVRMGFGLHVGWAIEGTIGSRFKIDASYLSPNVNTAARLEAATHMYGAPLLMSGFFADELSAAARSFCRMVDVVAVKGSTVPLELWTFDIANFPEGSLCPVVDSRGVQQPVDFQTDAFYRELQRDIDAHFMLSFNDAVQEYVAGDWAQARSHLADALQRYQNDGPAKVLMRVLSAQNFRAPADWKGFRALTSKT
ncbi:hypothetical protein M885DRAFT_583406 [Pelagophyceae sp. CCMP2097]|nr:hypothetical protein M885DRAFT_583406 [Pelagophyceae sp. CCMP2097]